MATKHHNSTSTELRKLFDERISVRYIAETLMVRDVTEPARLVFAEMKRLDFDVVGVRNGDQLVGYALRGPKSDGDLGTRIVTFKKEDLAGDDLPVPEALRRMRAVERLFVETEGRITSIVTRGDLQKAPVRMWLFALISMIEMQMLRLIREAYSDEAWRRFFPGEDQLVEAERTLRKRRNKNLSIDLLDCLSLGQKSVIILRTDAIKQAVRATDMALERELLDDLGEVRNNLAHAGDIVAGYWPKLAIVAEQAEERLQRYESAAIQRTNQSHSKLT